MLPNLQEENVKFKNLVNKQTEVVEDHIPTSFCCITSITIVYANVWH